MRTDEIRRAVEELANAPIGIGMDRWNSISNTFLNAAAEIDRLQAALDEAIAFERARTFSVAGSDAPVPGVTPQWWIDAVIVRTA